MGERKGDRQLLVSIFTFRFPGKKNGTVQSDVRCPHQRKPACMLLPVLWGDSNAEESNKVDLQQLVVSPRSVPKAIQILPYTSLDLGLWFGFLFLVFFSNSLSKLSSSSDE